MKRKLRIIRIWFFGRYKLMKAIQRYRRGQLFRDLNLLTPDYIPKIIAKYGNISWLPHYLEFGRLDDNPTKTMTDQINKVADDQTKQP